MKYSESEREHIKKSINTDFFNYLEFTFNNFLEWYNDSTLSEAEKNILISTMLISLKPSVLIEQYIRLEMIKYSKEKFIEYPEIVEKISKVDLEDYEK